MVSKPGKSVFDLNHDVKVSLVMGKLCPVALIPCVPSDRFRIGQEAVIRMAPMLAPIMHRVNVTFHNFFIPNRIVWPNWEKFITNTPLTEDGPIPAFPTITLTETLWESSRLFDYFFIPKPLPGVSVVISAIPFAQYQMCYNEYYRDQNLIDEVSFELIDGDNTANTDLFVYRSRAWEHDYFTSCLPFAQKGEAVDIPLGQFNENVPVKANNSGGITDTLKIVQATDQPSSTASQAFIPFGASDIPGDTPNTLYAETEGLGVEPTTINDLRKAFRLQEWLEKMARAGSRYFEMLRSMFGIISPDARLQRPEYIGGSISPMMISEVLNTTGTDNAAQGTMAGHGVSVAQGNAGMYTCIEYGNIITLMSVMPKTAYQDGLDRHWSKTTDPFEYYFPQFDHIGEQEVLNKEVYMSHSQPNQTFGYLPRYAEYKFINSKVAGDFRTTLDYWHMGRQLDFAVALNEDFVTADPTNRIFAVEGSTDNLWCHVYHKITAIRPMSKYSTPTF